MEISRNPLKKKAPLVVLNFLLGLLWASPDGYSQNIPDVNFANAIRSTCPACIDASNNLLPPATNLTILDVSNKNIADLTGIGGFTSLLYLYCNNNKLTSLPTLPVNLSWLFCTNNQLTSLPNLPNNLSLLYCNFNQLTGLPILPSAMQRLVCDNNKLTALPTLPDRLAELHCTHNLLTSLPDLTNLYKLYCNNNQLTNLTAFSNHLLFLDCSYNQLTRLPELPVYLNELYCSNNKITNLPLFPSTNVEGLQILNCTNNQLNCLPVLPKTLTSLYIAGNSITCLPNKVPALSYYSSIDTPLPVCELVDQNFVLAISQACPSCIDSCKKLLPPAASLTSLDISNKNISDLSGISAFSGLQTLNCSNNQLNCLPTLPSALTKLVIDSDKITCLPTLLPNLQVYKANGELIATPPVCTHSIPDLNFADAIRSVCPTCIDVCNNLLEPAAVLKSLNVSYKNIANLTGIEGFSSLQSLYCQNNQLISLPPLPNSLQFLNCQLNQLTGLPELPHNLTSLYCNNNFLTSFSTLPPNLQILQCYNNQLSCLPTLPNSLFGLYIDVDKITCLPNTVTGLRVYNQYQSSIPTPPLCPTTLTHSSGTLATGTYVATQTINSKASLSIGTTNYHASQAIILNPGFQTAGGRTFSVEIRGCK
jgi:Leucine-rich repeat (LRR) protein